MSKETDSIMLKQVLMGALLLAVPACASVDTPVETVPQVPGKVVIVGDSISLGLGAMGASKDCEIAVENTSLNVTYGVQVAKALGTDYVLYAWPGAGLVRNYADATSDTISVRMHRLEDENALDNTGPVQLVLVNVGTHDFHQYDATDAFIPAMEDLLTMMAGHFPDATIYALTGPMLGGKDGAFLDQAVRTAVDTVNTADGTHIRYLALNGGDPAIALGCQWHPSMPAHEYMAGMILDDLKFGK